MVSWLRPEYIWPFSGPVFTFTSWVDEWSYKGMVVLISDQKINLKAFDSRYLMSPVGMAEKRGFRGSTDYRRDIFKNLKHMLVA